MASFILPMEILILSRGSSAMRKSRLISKTTSFGRRIETAVIWYHKYEEHLLVLYELDL